MVLATVPALTAPKILDRIQAVDDVALAKCPNCGEVNIRPGFTRLLAFVCRECGMGVTVGPELEWAEFRLEDKEWGIKAGISTLCRDNKHVECVGHGKHGGFMVFCVCPCHRVVQP
jgi:hypothetical protein